MESAPGWCALQPAEDNPKQVERLSQAPSISSILQPFVNLYAFLHEGARRCVVTLAEHEKACCIESTSRRCRSFHSHFSRCGEHCSCPLSDFTQLAQPD